MTPRISIVLVALIAITALLETHRHAQSQYTGQPAVQAVVPYNASVYGGAAGLTPEQGKKLIALLESIDGKLDVLQSIDDRLTAGPAKAKAVPKMTWPQVITAKCAACHNSKVTKGDFILVTEDGKSVKPLNAREWIKVVEAVDSGHMPPPEKGRLSPAEKAVFVK